MDHRTSGKFTSKNLIWYFDYLDSFTKMNVQDLRRNFEHNDVKLLFSLPFSALGGSHGVPRVHYKGRQGDYYVMV